MTTGLKLFFFHNPKAAGTSLIDALNAIGSDRSYSPHMAHTICEYDRLSGTFEQFRGYDCYIGHYSRDMFEAVRDGHCYVTNFRHPVSRVLSLYNYFRLIVPPLPRTSPEQITDFRCVDAAKSMSFADFVACDHPDIRVYTSDHHFRQLTRTQWVFEVPTASIDEACGFIDGAACFYVCEFPEISQRWMRSALGIETVPRSNRTDDKAGSMPISEIDPVTWQTILDINQRDLALYRYAVDRLLGIRIA